MNIQSINTSSLAGVALQRPAAVAGDAGSAASQHATTAVATQATTTNTNQDHVSKEQLNAAVKATNDFVSMVNDSVQFSVDDETGKTIVKVVDKSTKEVIRQIPSEEMLAIAKALDGIKGLLVRQKA